MFRPVIRLLAFFFKELNEVRRQPRLLASLLLGPFLILLLFGAGYQGSRPILRTILVIPQNSGLDQKQIDEVKNVIGTNFQLVGVDSNEQDAMAKLRAGQVDVVQILPEDVEQRVVKGEQSPVRFEYNEINPLTEQWIQYLGYAQVNELNRAILLEATVKMQKQAADTKDKLAAFNKTLDAMEKGDQSSKQESKKSISDLKAAIGLLLLSPTLTEGSDNPDQTRQDLLALQNDLDQLDQENDQGTVKNDPARIKSTRERVTRLEDVLGKISSLPPQVIVSPLQQKYENLHGSSLSFMYYYAPSVFALIIQHIAITMAALSLVHERLLGALELFRVAPISMLQVIIGKYLGYILFIAIISTLLIGLMLALQVPFLGSLLLFAGLLLLLTLASLGIGFLISSVSSSQSQAVQLSMLTLLLSIFFSGFFLPLENFIPAIRIVGYIIPLTHGVIGFQDIMLRGIAPGDLQWLSLGIIALVTFLLVALITNRQFNQSFGK